MGKGDKRSKRGKRIVGSYGVSRPRTKLTERGSSFVAEKPKKAKSTAKKASEKKAAVKKAAVAAKGDDLTKIEGIGPKVKEVLTEAGLGTFADIAKTDAAKIGEILVEANSRYKMFDPTSWPQQAQLAADGKWEELKTLQEELDGGKAK